MSLGGGERRHFTTCHLLGKTGFQAKEVIHKFSTRVAVTDCQNPKIYFWEFEKPEGAGRENKPKGVK